MCVCVCVCACGVCACVRVFVLKHTPFHQHCDVQFIIVVVEKYIYIFPSDMLRSKGFTVVGGNVSFMKLVTAWAILIVYLVFLVGMINRH